MKPNKPLSWSPEDRLRIVLALAPRIYENFINGTYGAPGTPNIHTLVHVACEPEAVLETERGLLEAFVALHEDQNLVGGLKFPEVPETLTESPDRLRLLHELHLTWGITPRPTYTAAEFAAYAQGMADILTTAFAGVYAQGPTANPTVMELLKKLTRLTALIGALTIPAARKAN